MRDLQSFRNRLEHRTLAWSASSVLAAAVLYLRPSPFLRALAISLAAWAGLGILSSLLSKFSSLRRSRALSEQADPFRLADKNRALNQALQLAMALGAAGAAAGLSLALSAAAPEWRGALGRLDGGLAAGAAGAARAALPGGTARLFAGRIARPGGLSAVEPPDGLELLAPFSQANGGLRKTAGGMILPLLSRYFYPLKDTDFADPRLQSTIRDFLPAADLEDSRTVSALRSIGFPTSILEQVVRSEWHARRAAGSLRLPLLIVQGAEDAVVHPESTRRLLQRFPVPPRYVEVPGEHDLTWPSGPSWEEVRRETLSFLKGVWSHVEHRSRH